MDIVIQNNLKLNMTWFRKKSLFLKYLWENQLTNILNKYTYDTSLMRCMRKSSWAKSTNNFMIYLWAYSWKSTWTMLMICLRVWARKKTHETCVQAAGKPFLIFLNEPSSNNCFDSIETRAQFRVLFFFNKRYYTSIVGFASAGLIYTPISNYDLRVY